MDIKHIELYGAPAACEEARFLLENLPEIKRIDTRLGSKAITLFLNEPLLETILIPLLAGSGINGFSYG